MPAFYEESGQESDDENDCGAQDDGQVGMQVDAWQLPHLCQ